MRQAIKLLKPNWPAPAYVHAWSVARGGGVSLAPYCSLNLSDHVGDNPDAVETNRTILKDALRLPSQPAWLAQVHGTDCCCPSDTSRKADAAFTKEPGHVCVVLTADCLPVLCCDRNGHQIAIAHAGWRGLAAGVLENTIAQFCCASDELLVWLGPAIGPKAFEVSNEVRDVFIAAQSEASGAFKPTRPDHWLADLYQLARLRLAAIGVHAVFGGDYCTYSQPRLFYSYRREHVTGRMASLIWLEEPAPKQFHAV